LIRQDLPNATGYLSLYRQERLHFNNRYTDKNDRMQSGSSSPTKSLRTNTDCQSASTDAAGWGP